MKKALLSIAIKSIYFLAKSSLSKCSLPALALVAAGILTPLLTQGQQVQQLKMSDFVLFSGAGGPGTSSLR
jgi:hypothetical protein